MRVDRVDHIGDAGTEGHGSPRGQLMQHKTVDGGANLHGRLGMFDIEQRLAGLDRLARIDVNGDHDAVLVVRRFALEEYFADYRHQAISREPRR